jgi:mono/diheme cytochrome c family protein
MGKHMRKILLLLTMWTILLAPGNGQATTQWNGVYTDAQAERGAGQYAQHCAVCHGAALEGNGETPPLTGEFIPDWAGTTLADIYDKITVTMPLNAPGTLRPQTAADILAFILKKNDFPSSSRELSASEGTLKTIAFTASKASVKSTPAGK